MESQIEKPIFLTELLGEVENFDPSTFQPDQPIKKTDTVLGDCPLYARKLYAYSRMACREEERAEVELKFVSGDDAAKVSLTAMRVINGSKREICSDIFWALLNEEFKVWGSQRCLGIRAGWKVTESDQPENPLKKFLAGIIGPNGPIDI